MTARDFYPFESQEAVSLSLIPLRVRYKLDCAGIRLRLAQWHALTTDEKMLLLRLPVTTPADLEEYRACLTRMVCSQGAVLRADETGADEQVWRDVGVWPAVVVRQCEVQRLPLPPVVHWQNLAEPDRHALFVLARSNHSQQEFLAAMTLFVARC